MVSYFRYLIVGLVVSFAFVVCAQQDSTPESYTKKVLIEAKWGNELGEFQLDPMNETQTWTTYLALDGQGNIYIADPNNYRINIFNQSGSYINTLVLAESDVIEKNKLPLEDRGSLIQGIGVNSKDHIFVALSAFGNNTTVLEFDKNGNKIDKYFFPKAYIKGFSLLEDKNNIYLSGSWCLIEKSLHGYQYVYAAVPLSWGKTNSDKNSIGIVDKIKDIAKQTDVMLKEKKFKNGYSGHYSGSGDVVIKNRKSNVVFNRHHYDLIESHRFAYKPEHSASVGAGIVFDNEGNFYVLQGKSSGLEVIKIQPLLGK
jgi:hypothetical protein